MNRILKNNLFSLWIPLIFIIFHITACREDVCRITGPVTPNAMVVSAHPIASRVGVEILKKGGNAIDAAIAVQFALAVVYPAAGNIGGGGFMVIRQNNGEYFSLDFREKAPLGASRNMYLDENGEVITELSTRGHLASGVPGTVAGMVKAHDRFGTLAWDQLVQPAIDLAAKGFPLTRREAAKLNDSREDFIKTNILTPDFLINEKWEAGDTFIIKDLAKTLVRIRDQQGSGFYSGVTADLIVAEMKRGNGIITYDDLIQYEAVWRSPVEGNYKSYRVISMGPPSSGGIALIQMLKLIQGFEVDTMSWNSTIYIHLLTEVEKRVYADRAEYMGDMDFYPVPLLQLTNEIYLNKRMKDFSFDRSVPAEHIYAGNTDFPESSETTHFSIVDPLGMTVSVTTTLNGNFGSKVVVHEAGFLLNNEMDDFSIKPGYPNMFGLVGGEANAIEAGKRMLSSMAPTIVEKNGSLYMVLGSPGGSRIITTVFQCLLNVIEFNMTMQEAVKVPRFHHQWMPDTLYYEAGRFPDQVRKELIKKGHTLKLRKTIGSVNAIRIIPEGGMEGGADPRGDNTAAGF